MKKAGRIIIHILMVIVLVLTAAVNYALTAYKPMLESFTKSFEQTSNKETMEAYKKKGAEYAEQVEEEGIVLLQNKDNILPLADSVKKVNVFGWGSTAWLASGSGSAEVSPLKTDFLKALSDYGISYNEELTEMYENFMAERPYARALSTYSSQMCRLYEPSVHDTEYYTEEMLEHAKNYSDTAIVVLSRYCGESNDCPKTQYKVTKTLEGAYDESGVIVDAGRTYLDISTEEEELLAYCGENFENVIVLINATNAMTLGFLETTPGIDACLLAGTTGGEAAAAIPKVLYGEVNPSGKTVDTYAYDLASAATWANAGAEGEGMYTNADGLYPADGVTTNGNVGDAPLYDGVYYVDYAENIYIGYKWYETADAEGYWDDVENEYGKGYEGVVQYPFGYGLSYTQFDYEIVDSVPAAGQALDKDGQIEVTVKVTNVGKAAGKEAVQLYYTAPYIRGEIEKSAVELCGFAKTDILKPGESENLTITFDVSDMASYDCYDANGNGFAGYELDAGEYQVKAMKNAHEPGGENTLVSFEVKETIQYETDPVTGAVVKNRFTGTDTQDGAAIDGSDSDANIRYMTRADFEGTFPVQKAENRVMTDNVKARNLYTEEMAQAWIDESDEPITTGARNKMKLTDSSGFTELAYELGADYDSEKWDNLLDQLTVEEMENMVLHGYSKTAAAESVGKRQTGEVDGPSMVAGFIAAYFPDKDNLPTAFPNETVIAQTWNKELAYQMGLSEGAQAGEMDYTGWYAPSANMHRSPLGGRNYEYYSEDSYLSGVMAANTVRGH